MRRAPPALLLLCLFMAALTACGRAGAGAGPDSGIRGRVVVGPQCPNLEPSNPCPPRPYQAEIHVVDPSGKVVATVHSGRDGRFSLRIAPGRYVLRPVQPRPRTFPLGREIAVTVRPHHITHVNVLFDTGIR